MSTQGTLFNRAGMTVFAVAEQALIESGISRFYNALLDSGITLREGAQIGVPEDVPVTSSFGQLVDILGTADILYQQVDEDQPTAFTFISPVVVGQPLSITGYDTYLLPTEEILNDLDSALYLELESQGVVLSQGLQIAVPSDVSVEENFGQLLDVEPPVTIFYQQPDSQEAIGFAFGINVQGQELVVEGATTYIVSQEAHQESGGSSLYEALRADGIATPEGTQIAVENGATVDSLTGRLLDISGENVSIYIQRPDEDQPLAYTFMFMEEQEPDPDPDPDPGDPDDPDDPPADPDPSEGGGMGDPDDPNPDPDPPPPPPPPPPQTSSIRLPEFPAISRALLASQHQSFFNEARSGRDISRQRGGHKWEFDLVWSTRKRDQMLPIIAFLEGMQGRLEPFEVVIPRYSFTRGNITGNVTANGSDANSSGSRRVNLTVNGNFRAGDFIRFMNHTKVYMLTQNLVGSGEVNITPPLIRNVQNTQVQYNEVAFQVKQRENRNQYQLGLGPRVQVSAQVRESYI